MRIEKFCGEDVLVIEDGDDIKITIPSRVGRTCIYLTGRNGKIDITGGTAIIGKIAGESLIEKVEK
jgi:hypothetical protein